MNEKIEVFCIICKGSCFDTWHKWTSIILIILWPVGAFVVVANKYVNSK